MYSIGELIDKLVVENLKLYFIREQLNKSIDHEEIAIFNEKMSALNSNRNKLIELIDEKIDKVVSGSEKNVILTKVRTI